MENWTRIWWWRPVPRWICTRVRFSCVLITSYFSTAFSLRQCLAVRRGMCCSVRLLQGNPQTSARPVFRFFLTDGEILFLHCPVLHLPSQFSCGVFVFRKHQHALNRLIEPVNDRQIWNLSPRLSRCFRPCLLRQIIQQRMLRSICPIRAFCTAIPACL